MHMRSVLLALALAPVTFAPGLPTSAIAQAQARVEFAAGNDTGAVNGSVTGRDYADYILGAKAGQTMSVSLIVTEGNGNGSAFFNILPPGSSGEAIHIGSMDGPDATVDLPDDGDYTIRVYLMGDDKDSGKTVGYTVSVTIM